VEFYSDLSEFQAGIISAIKNNSEMELAVKVSKQGTAYRFSLTTKQSNITRDINLSYGNEGFYYLEEPLSSYFLRLKQRHIEYLEHEKTIRCKEQERKKLKALEEKQQETQRLKELAASKYRDKVRLEGILAQLEHIYRY